MKNFWKNHYKKLFCFAMIGILCFGFAVSGVLDTPTAIDDMQVRSVNVEQSTYGEKLDGMLNEFNSYETNCTDTSIGFTGEMNASVSEILAIDALADPEEENVVKKFTADYDYEDDMLYIDVAFYAGDTLLQSTETAVRPEFDEARDDVYIDYEGERLYFTENFAEDGLNECIVAEAVAATGVVVVGLSVLVWYAMPPTVVQEVHQEIEYRTEYIRETVTQKVKSIFRWIKRLVTRTVKKVVRVVKNIVVAKELPRVKIGETEYTMVDATYEYRSRLHNSAYYIALADPTNDKMYLSKLDIKSSMAAGIMNAGIKIPCIGNKKRQMLVSVYTKYESNADAVIVLAGGYRNDTPRGNPHWDHGVRHYHAKKEFVIEDTYGKVCRGPHMFFDIY